MVMIFFSMQLPPFESGNHSLDHIIVKSTGKVNKTFCPLGKFTEDKNKPRICVACYRYA
jgi:hypothetical protein